MHLFCFFFEILTWLIFFFFHFLLELFECLCLKLIQTCNKSVVATRWKKWIKDKFHTQIKNKLRFASNIFSPPIFINYTISIYHKYFDVEQSFRWKASLFAWWALRSHSFLTLRRDWLVVTMVMVQWLNLLWFIPLLRLFWESEAHQLSAGTSSNRSFHFALVGSVFTIIDSIMLIL